MTGFRELRDRTLERVVDLAVRRPVAVLVVAVATAVVSVGYAAGQLTVKTETNALISPDTDWNQRFLDYAGTFDSKGDIIVVLEGDRPERRQLMLDSLAGRLKADSSVERVFHRIDPAPLRARGLVYLDTQELQDLKGDLQAHGDMLSDLADDPALVQLLELLNREVSRAVVGGAVSELLGGGDERKDELAPAREPLDLSMLITVLEGIDARIGGGEPRYESPWSTYFGGQDLYAHDGYLVTGDEDQFTLLLARPRTGEEGNAVDRIQAHLDALSGSFPEIRAGVTGSPAIAVAEGRTTVRDIRGAGWLALAGVTLVLVLGFRRLRNPLLAVVSLAIGTGWAAGAAALLVGHLTILSVAFASILFGLGIDFSVHLLARYEDERGGQSSPANAMRAAVRASGPGVVSGAITTSLAFYGLAMTEFVGLAELGIIAGTGVLLCLLAALTVLPALVVLVPGRAPRRRSPRRWLAPVTRLEAIGVRTFRRPVLLLGIVAVLAVAGLALVPRIQFNGNLLDLQAEGVESVYWERRLIDEADRASWFAASVAPDLETARARAERFEALPEVARTQSLADIVPGDQQRRIQEARALAPLVAEISASRRQPRPVDLEQLAQVIDRLRFKIRAPDATEWDPAKKPVEAQIVRARRLLDALAAGTERLAMADPADRQATAASLSRYQRQVFDDFYDALEVLEAAEAVQPITVADVPHELRRTLLGADGSFLVRVFPREDIWQDEEQKAFVTAIRTVDPTITGAPIQVFEARRLMVRGYLEGALYALVVVLVVLFLDLRRPREVLLALAPLAIGAAWTAGSMGAMGLSFNLANLVLVPLMIGIGIDVGIHLVHRLRREGQVGWALIWSSTGRAVLVSGLTTVVGFGSLSIAQHRGIHSMGVLISIGVLAVMVAGLVALPAISQLAASRSRTTRADPAHPTRALGPDGSAQGQEPLRGSDPRAHK